MPTTVAVHTISFRGTAGAIFMLLVTACLFYVVGFATEGWDVTGSRNIGLWRICSCGENNMDDDWFHAVQSMITLGLFGLAIAMILICLYMCVHNISKNSTIIGLVVVCFLSVVVMLIGFIIWGVKMENPHWSFGLCVIGAFFTVLSGVLSFVQLRNSGVHI